MLRGSVRPIERLLHRVIPILNGVHVLRSLFVLTSHVYYMKKCNIIKTPVVTWGVDRWCTMGPHPFVSPFCRGAVSFADRSVGETSHA